MTDEGPATPSYEDLFERAPIGYLLTTGDGTITRVNDTFAKWTGHSADALVGRSFRDLLTAGGQLFYETRYTSVLTLSGEVREVALSVVCADGRELPVLVNALADRDANGNLLGVRAAVFDVTGRHDYERQLVVARRAAESAAVRLRVLQDASSAFGATTSADDLARALRDSVRLALDARQSAVVLLDGSNVVRLGDDGLREELWEEVQPLALESMVRGESIMLGNLDAASARSSQLAEALHLSRLEALAISPIADEGVCFGVVISFFGRTRTLGEQSSGLLAALARQAAQTFSRMRLQRELEHRALHDQLTGLPNRKSLQERLASAITIADRRHRTVALIFIDLDGFKIINDDLGHRAGDAVLAEIGERLGSAVRGTDTVARYGGDEFVVVCEDADEAEAMQVAERLRLSIGVPLSSVPAPYGVTASIGVALWTPHDGSSVTADAALRAADEAMYQAKREGRDRIRLVEL